MFATEDFRVWSNTSTQHNTKHNTNCAKQFSSVFVCHFLGTLTVADISRMSWITIVHGPASAGVNFSNDSFKAHGTQSKFSVQVTGIRISYQKLGSNRACSILSKFLVRDSGK